MSKTIDKLVLQCLRDIRLKKARRYRALLRHHQLFGLEHRAKLVVSSHANAMILQADVERDGVGKYKGVTVKKVVP